MHIQALQAFEIVGAAARRRRQAQRNEQKALAYFHVITVGGVSSADLMRVLGVPERTARHLIARLLERGAIEACEKRTSRNVHGRYRAIRDLAA